MKALRRIRYWLGAKLLLPHVQHQWEWYNMMSKFDGPDHDRRNCAYISIGLRYAVDKRRRESSARKIRNKPRRSKMKKILIAVLFMAAVVLPGGAKSASAGDYNEVGCKGWISQSWTGINYAVAGCDTTKTRIGAVFTIVSWQDCWVGTRITRQYGNEAPKNGRSTSAGCHYTRWIRSGWFTIPA